MYEEEKCAVQNFSYICLCQNEQKWKGVLLRYACLVSPTGVDREMFVRVRSPFFLNLFYYSFRRMINIDFRDSKRADFRPRTV
jgi:hypothetical protein